MPSDPVMVVLLASGVVAGICLVSAALLLVAERYLVNYGPCAIDINRGARRLTVQGGSTLLASLIGQGIFIPSACGGKGTCAYCKVKILDGGGPVAPTETTLLKSDELRDGVRISCQVKVRNDVAIEIPPQLFLVKEFRGRVERIRDLTHDIKELRIALLEPNQIEFTAGQYVQLRTPEYGDNPEAVYRAYSISSPPSDKSVIELVVRLVPGGICTTWVFKYLREGDEVLLNGPHGDFRLSDSTSEMVWIAGGSGMAPFWSMIRHMKEHNIVRPTRYFFGAVRRRDLFYVDELTALAKELEWFQFTPALSGAAGEDSWTGETGLITEVVDRHVPASSGAEAYLCGSSGMIDASINVLKTKGMPDDRIFYDKFT